MIVCMITTSIKAPCEAEGDFHTFIVQRREVKQLKSFLQSEGDALGERGKHTMLVVQKRRSMLLILPSDHVGRGNPDPKRQQSYNIFSMKENLNNFFVLYTFIETNGNAS